MNFNTFTKSRWIDVKDIDAVQYSLATYRKPEYQKQWPWSIDYGRSMKSLELSTETSKYGVQLQTDRLLRATFLMYNANERKDYQFQNVGQASAYPCPHPQIVVCY